VALDRRHLPTQHDVQWIVPVLVICQWPVSNIMGALGSPSPVSIHKDSVESKIPEINRLSAELRALQLEVEALTKRVSEQPNGLSEVTASVAAMNTHLASLVRCNPSDLIFTSGATESNNLALKGRGTQETYPPFRRRSWPPKSTKKAPYCVSN
jgi:hypothetical protein